MGRRKRRHTQTHKGVCERELHPSYIVQLHMKGWGVVQPNVVDDHIHTLGHHHQLWPVVLENREDHQVPPPNSRAVHHSGVATRDGYVVALCKVDEVGVSKGRKTKAGNAIGAKVS